MKTRYNSADPTGYRAAAAVIDPASLIARIALLERQVAVLCKALDSRDDSCCWSAWSLAKAKEGK